MHEDNGHHHHDHDHNHDLEHTENIVKVDPEQIRTLIMHLLKHNVDHITNLKKWHTQITRSDLKNVAAEFQKIVKLSEKIDRHFKAALEKSKKNKQ